MNLTLSESYWDTAIGDPYAFYERAREVGDVVWDPAMNAWLVLSHAAVREVLKDDALFIHPFLTMDAGEEYRKIRGDNPRSFFFLQGEKHRAIHRWWVRDLLSPQWVARYQEAAIDPVVGTLARELGKRDSFDLVADYAERIPVRIFGALLELPDQSEEHLVHLKQLNDHIAEFASIASALRLEGEVSAEHKAVARRAVAAAEELDEILRPLVKERRGGTGNDIISRLWAGGPAIFEDWNEVDTLDACRRLLFAGIDTTTHAVANGFQLLLNDADLLERVRSGGAREREGLVEETLRLTGSVQFRSRRATADTELAGVPIKKGDMVVVLLMAANRDPEQFVCPHAVNLERTAPRNHLAFLYGPRSCPGAALARAEVSAAIRHGLENFGGLRRDTSAVPPVFKGFMMRSYRPLHVRVDAR